MIGLAILLIADVVSVNQTGGITAGMVGSVLVGDARSVTVDGNVTTTCNDVMCVTTGTDPVETITRPSSGSDEASVCDGVAECLDVIVGDTNAVSVSVGHATAAGDKAVCLGTDKTGRIWQTTGNVIFFFDDGTPAIDCTPASVEP